MATRSGWFIAQEHTEAHIKYWSNQCSWQNCSEQQLHLQVGRWGQGCFMHLLQDGISMWEVSPCNAASLHRWCLHGSMQGNAAKAFWVHIGFWHLGLAGSSEFKVELCLHERGLLGLCFKPAFCNKMLVKGWLEPQPKFQTCPLSRPRASRGPWDPEVNLCAAGPCRTSSSQVTHSLLLSWSNGAHTQSRAFVCLRVWGRGFN